MRTRTTYLALRCQCLSILFTVGMSLTPSIASAQQHVLLRASDGWVVASDVYGGGAHGLVLAHGGRLTKESWRAQAERLAAAGNSVIAIDLRGFGQSQTPPNAVASDSRKELDVIAAIDYLRSQGAVRISLVGGSMGGDAAADATTTVAPGYVDCLVLLSSAGGERPDQIRARKVLVIAARDDQRSNGERRFPNLEAGYNKITVPKALLRLEGTAHAQAIFDTPDGEKATEAILRLLSAP